MGFVVQDLAWPLTKDVSRANLYEEESVYDRKHILINRS